ncbi:MAG: hypothetical protein V3V74_07635 [Nitrosomonadaceae bacterium]
MSTVIFNNIDHDDRQLHRVSGCEKLAQIRMSAPGVILTIYSEDPTDAYHRPLEIAKFEKDADFCLPCLGCGQVLIFELRGFQPDTADNGNVRVTILDEGCVPKPCCDC